MKSEMATMGGLGSNNLGIEKMANDDYIDVYDKKFTRCEPNFGCFK